MHREFKNLLDKTIGRSEFVVAACVDIRGFSSFSNKVESPHAAVFIKKVYRKLLDEYFSDASFFKPTGDGLLIVKTIVPYEEERAKQIVVEAVAKSISACRDFPSFCDNDPMIPFDVPHDLGIGLSIGPATGLFADGMTLDYSGRPLNLASRMMNLARPRGVVLESSVGIQRLPAELAQQFNADAVYVRGTAEREGEAPIKIYHTPDVVILPSSRVPIQRNAWESKQDTLKLREIKNRSPKFRYVLKKAPVDSRRVRIEVKYPMVRQGRRARKLFGYTRFRNFKCDADNGISKILVRFDLLVELLEELGVKDDWPVGIKITYPTR